jgi:hypothetical protein
VAGAVGEPAGEAEAAPGGETPDEEAAAEKPKRKTRRGSRGGRGRKKPVGAATNGSEPEPSEAAPEPATAELAAAELEPPSPNGGADAEAAPKKKPTRRGTRGGRGRRKPVAAGAESGEAAPEAAETFEEPVAVETGDS